MCFIKDCVHILHEQGHAGRKKFLVKELYLLWSDEAKESKGPDIPWLAEDYL